MDLSRTYHLRFLSCGGFLRLAGATLLSGTSVRVTEKLPGSYEDGRLVLGNAGITETLDGAFMGFSYLYRSSSSPLTLCISIWAIRINHKFIVGGDEMGGRGVAAMPQKTAGEGAEEGAGGAGYIKSSGAERSPSGAEPMVVGGFQGQCGTWCSPPGGCSPPWAH